MPGAAFAFENWFMLRPLDLFLAVLRFVSGQLPYMEQELAGGASSSVAPSALQDENYLEDSKLYKILVSGAKQVWRLLRTGISGCWSSGFPAYLGHSPTYCCFCNLQLTVVGCLLSSCREATARSERTSTGCCSGAYGNMNLCCKTLDVSATTLVALTY